MAARIRMTDFSQSLETRARKAEDVSPLTQVLELRDMSYVFEFFPPQEYYIANLFVSKIYSDTALYEHIDESPTPQPRPKKQKTAPVSRLPHAFTERGEDYLDMIQLLTDTAASVFHGAPALIADFLDYQVGRCKACRSAAVNTSIKDMACCECGVGPCCAYEMRPAVISRTVFYFCDACVSDELSDEELGLLEKLNHRFWVPCNGHDSDDENMGEDEDYDDYDKDHLFSGPHGPKFNLIPKLAKLTMKDVEEVLNEGRLYIDVIESPDYRYPTALSKDGFCSFYEHNGLAACDAAPGEWDDQEHWLVAGHVLMHWLLSHHYCDICHHIQQLYV